MTELSEKAKEYIKLYGMQRGLRGGLFELSTLQLYTDISAKFPPEIRRKIYHILRKAYYINFNLEWKILAFIGERKMMQAEFKELCNKWEFLELLIENYNKTIEEKNIAASEAIRAANIVKECAKDFAPITIFKSGKVQLQNRYIQRTFDKLRNRHKKRLAFHALINVTIENYIKENKLSEYITKETKEIINVLTADLAHAAKYSTEEFFLKYAFRNDSDKKREAQKYAVYPAFNEGVIDATEVDHKKCYNFLFSDLEQIEKWQQEQWGI